MSILTEIVLVLAAVAVTGVLFYTLIVIRPESAGAKKRPKGVQEAHLEVLAARLAAVEVTTQALPSLWEEERKRALHQANRSEQAVRDLEAKLNPQPEAGDEDEDSWEGEAGVLPLHAGPGGEEGLPAVHEGVGLNHLEEESTAQIVEAYHRAIGRRR